MPRPRCVPAVIVDQTRCGTRRLIVSTSPPPGGLEQVAGLLAPQAGRPDRHRQGRTAAGVQPQGHRAGRPRPAGPPVRPWPARQAKPRPRGRDPVPCPRRRTVPHLLPHDGVAGVRSSPWSSSVCVDFSGKTIPGHLGGGLERGHSRSTQGAEPAGEVGEEMDGTTCAPQPHPAAAADADHHGIDGRHTSGGGQGRDVRYGTSPRRGGVAGEVTPLVLVLVVNEGDCRAATAPGRMP